MKQYLHLGLKAILLIIGCISVVLGIIGVFLPLLPTTPFLILAAACFARSSSVFHNWLLNHPAFGQSLRNWQQHKCIEPKTKKKATFFIILSFSVSIYWVNPVLLKVMLLCMAMVLLIFIWKTKDRPDNTIN